MFIIAPFIAPFLPTLRPFCQHCGLYIEMKSEKGRTSIDQSKFLRAVSDNGYAVSVCYSANEAIKRIEDYYQ